VPRNSILSCLLILVFSTSTLGCVTGRSSHSGIFCSSTGIRQTCKKAKSSRDVRPGSACRETLKRPLDRCNLRGFLQSQLAVLANFEISTPSLPAMGEVSLLSRSIFVASSVGSPQTDRGPPAS